MYAWYAATQTKTKNSIKMIKMTKNEIQNLKPTTNKVLVKPDRKLDEINISSGGKLYFDASFDPNMHAPVTGEVVAVCTRTKMSDQQFVPRIEVESGDRAVWSYYAGSNSTNRKIEQNIMDEDEQLYFFLDIDQIYAVRRGSELVAMNHYHICEPVSADIKTQLVLPDSITKGRKSVLVAKVLFAPLENTVYKKDVSPGCRVEAGRYVCFDKNSDFPLEYELHRSFMGRKELIGLHQRDIIAEVLDLSKITL